MTWRFESSHPHSNGSGSRREERIDVKTTLSERDGNTVKLAVEVSTEELQEAFDKKLRQLSREVRLPGFRPGKAPAAMIRQRLGDEESANEDARFVLPGACETRLMLTMNARELMHFFSLRCCNRAQWEIRGLAWRMLALTAEVAPALFANAGPACVRGACSEGSMTCGKAAEVRKRHAEIVKGGE